MILFILTVCLKSQMASSQLMPTATLLSPLRSWVVLHFAIRRSACLEKLRMRSVCLGEFTEMPCVQ